jgi:AAA15 family ATPase/GTPase
MYTGFKVKNYRCFKSLELNNLNRVNLIAGLNNAGKTSLLEALFIHAGAYNPEIALRVNVFRGLELSDVNVQPLVPSPWNSLFRNYQSNESIELVACAEGKVPETVKLRVVKDSRELTDIYRQYLQRQDNQYYSLNRKERRNMDRLDKKTSSNDKTTDYLSTAAHVLEVFTAGGDLERLKFYHIFDRKGQRIIPVPPGIIKQSVFLPARMRPITEDIERFGVLETEKRQTELLDVLKIIEPRLSKLSLVIENGLPSIQGDIGLDRLLPLALMGEGTSRLSTIIMAIASARDGMVMIDEIENGFHYSVLSKVWAAINRASLQFNTQIFVSTHSLECINAAHQTFSELPNYPFSFHRLEMINDAVSPVEYSQGSLSAALNSNFEVR